MSRKKRQRIEGYLHRLYGYAFSLSHEADAAQDLLHDAVVKALAAKSAPCDEAAYRAWLFSILRNVFIDQYRQSALRKELHAADAETGEGVWYGSESQQVNVIAARVAFGRLPLVHREIIGIIDVAGLTYREAAEALNVPVGTVMSRVSRARGVLCRAMLDATSGDRIEYLSAHRAARQNKR